MDTAVASVHPCTTCSSVFMSRSGLDQHIMNCNYMFTYHQWYYLQVLRTRGPNADFPYCCQFCGDVLDYTIMCRHVCKSELQNFTSRCKCPLEFQVHEHHDTVHSMPRVHSRLAETQKVPNHTVEHKDSDQPATDQSNNDHSSMLDLDSLEKELQRTVHSLPEVDDLLKIVQNIGQTESNSVHVDNTVPLPSEITTVHQNIQDADKLPSGLPPDVQATSESIPELDKAIEDLENARNTSLDFDNLLKELQMTAHSPDGLLDQPPDLQRHQDVKQDDEAPKSLDNHRDNWGPMPQLKSHLEELRCVSCSTSDFRQEVTQQTDSSVTLMNEDSSTYSSSSSPLNGSYQGSSSSDSSSSESSSDESQDSESSALQSDSVFSIDSESTSVLTNLPPRLPINKKLRVGGSEPGVPGPYESKKPTVDLDTDVSTDTQNIDVISLSSSDVTICVPKTDKNHYQECETVVNKPCKEQIAELTAVPSDQVRSEKDAKNLEAIVANKTVQIDPAAVGQIINIKQEPCVPKLTEVQGNNDLERVPRVLLVRLEQTVFGKDMAQNLKSFPPEEIAIQMKQVKLEQLEPCSTTHLPQTLNQNTDKNVLSILNQEPKKRRGRPRKFFTDDHGNKFRVNEEGGSVTLLPIPKVTKIPKKRGRPPTYFKDDNGKKVRIKTELIPTPTEQQVTDIRNNEGSSSQTFLISENVNKVRRKIPTDPRVLFAKLGEEFQKETKKYAGSNGLSLRSRPKARDLRKRVSNFHLGVTETTLNGQHVNRRRSRELKNLSVLPGFEKLHETTGSTFASTKYYQNLVDQLDAEKKGLKDYERNIRSNGRIKIENVEPCHEPLPKQSLLLDSEMGNVRDNVEMVNSNSSNSKPTHENSFEEAASTSHGSTDNMNVSLSNGNPEQVKLCSKIYASKNKPIHKQHQNRSEEASTSHGLTNNMKVRKVFGLSNGNPKQGSKNNLLQNLKVEPKDEEIIESGSKQLFCMKNAGSTVNKLNQVPRIVLSPLKHSMWKKYSNNSHKPSTKPHRLEQFVPKVVLVRLRTISPDGKSESVWKWQKKGANVNKNCQKRISIAQKISKNLLQKTLSNIQKPKRVFVCPVCQKKCYYQTHLNRHIQSHETVKKYRCKFCSSTFKYSDGLERHARNTACRYRRKKDVETSAESQVTETRIKSEPRENEADNGLRQDNCEKIVNVRVMCHKLMGHSLPKTICEPVNTIRNLTASNIRILNSENHQNILPSVVLVPLQSKFLNNRSSQSYCKQNTAEID